MTKQPDRDLPVFRCMRTLTGLSGNTPAWRFWCPWCRRDHTHSPAPGYRAAHCGDGPFKDTGYWLAGPGAKVKQRCNQLIEKPLANQ